MKTKLTRWLFALVTAAPLFAFAVPVPPQTELLTNNDFSAGLTGWTSGPSSSNSVAGTCSYNGVASPGSETLTATAGFTTGATTQALGSISQTAIGFRSCVLYQDIAIPVGATTLTISGEFGIKLVGGLASGDTAIFVGLYPTTAVPSFNVSTAIGNRLIIGGATNGAALQSQSTAAFNVASVAGTTVRLAIINAMQSTMSGTGAFVPGAGSVIGAGSVHALVTVATAPTAPVIGTAVRGNGQATVTFTAPVSNGGSAVTGYTVTSSPAGGVDSNAGSTGLSHVITGLTNGTAYTFTVTAANAVGASTASSASNSVTPATVPDAPLIGTAVGGNGQATVTFAAPVSNGGSAVTGYTVTSSPAGGVDSNAGGTGLSHVITGLTNGIAYTFTAKATNGVGSGVASAASNSITPAAPPTPQPSTPAPTTPYVPVAIGGFTGLPPILNQNFGQGAALTMDLVTMLSQKLGASLAFAEQTATGGVVLKGLIGLNGVGGSNLAFMPLATRSGDLRANGIYPLDSGQYELVVNGNVLVVAPALIHLDQLAALLPSLSARVNDNGSITASLNGLVYVVQPDINVLPRPATTAQIDTSGDGALRFIDAAGNSQILFPAFNEPATIRALLQALDTKATLAVQTDGTAAIVLNGQRLTLVPDLTLGVLAPERAGQRWWQEGANRYRFVNILPAGTTQGFTVR